MGLLYLHSVSEKLLIHGVPILWCMWSVILYMPHLKVHTHVCVTFFYTEEASERPHDDSLLFRMTPPHDVSTHFEGILSMTLEIVVLLACYARVDW